jgi:glutamate synthase (NADPH/NADH) large chain
LRVPIILGAMRPGVEVSLPELRRVAAGQGVAVMEDVHAAWAERYVRLPLYFPCDHTMAEHVQRLREAAVDAVQAGAEILVLEDRLATPAHRVCDPHVAVAVVDKALRETPGADGAALRRQVSIVLKAAGIRNVHDVVVAVGFGADALCPYAMVEQAVNGSPEPEAAAGRLLDGLQKGIEKVLSTLGIHEIRGYGRLVSAIGVAPEVLDALGIPGFCASEGRGLDFARLEILAEQGRLIRAGEESPGKIKLPRMYPKVWKVLARVGTSERGYDEFAETCQRLEDDQPVAIRHAVGMQLVPEADRIPADRVSSRVGEHELPFLISSMSFGSQGETPFRAYAEAAFRTDMLSMNGEGGEIHDMYGKYPKHRGVQIASGRFGVSSLLLNSS